MAKFCTGCGKELADEALFCTSCGSQAPKDAQSTPVAQPEPEKEVKAAITTEVKNNPPQKAEYIDNTTVSTGYYFGMMFVYALPVLGWLICLISAFAGKNNSKKNFARAILIWAIIGFVLSTIGFLLFLWLGEFLIVYLEEISGSL